MSAEIIREITVDFYEQKYVSVNAKQYDQASRFLSITCLNQGKVQHVDSKKWCAFARYREDDDLGDFNQCAITADGKILVELTKEMLSDIGISYVEIAIIEKGKVVITDNPGDFIASNAESIITTMTLYVNVKTSTINNIGTASYDDFDAFNNLLIKMTDDYNYVLNACKNSELSVEEYVLMIKEFGFKPMGTISFGELPSVENYPGNVYVIDNDFVTNDTFLNPGVSYPAGTIIYCTSRVIDKNAKPVKYYWDAFSEYIGVLDSNIVTVEELFDFLGISY